VRGSENKAQGLQAHPARALKSFFCVAALLLGAPTLVDARVMSPLTASEKEEPTRSAAEERLDAACPLRQRDDRHTQTNTVRVQHRVQSGWGDRSRHTPHTHARPIVATEHDQRNGLGAPLLC
jgi:hypothetical protein